MGKEPIQQTQQHTTEESIWEKRFESLCKLVEGQANQQERILSCLEGDALAGKKGLVHLVSDLNETQILTRKQVEEHAVKLKAHETEIAEGKSQRKTLITLLSLGSGGFAAAVTKFFGNNN
jgi:hypothetical protein